MEKKLKLVYYSSNTSGIHNFNLNFKSLVVTCTVLLLFLSTLIFFLSYLIVEIYTSDNISKLKSKKEILLSQLCSVEQKIGTLNEKLQNIEKLDNDLRVLSDLPKTDEDIKQLGTGGLNDHFGFNLQELPKELSNKTKNAQICLSTIEKKINFQNYSFSEIKSRIIENQEKIYHTPTIRPVKRGWLKSEFGYRIDPFLNIRCFHRGIDIAATKGTPVFSPADGIIKKANKTRWLDRGFGKYVYIDHGFGIITIFGHLSQIDVKVGQRIKRWEKIGEVGRTGRSTGNHLHYQIKINNRSKDPLDFILDQ